VDERTITSVLGLGLAVVSAGMINLGFLLQHRGLSRITDSSAGPLAQLRLSLRRREWVAGQALGMLGWAGQVTAVAIAPLALVQAFAAGGLALSLPLAAGLFHHPVRRSEARAVLAIALALASLPLGLPASHERVHTLTLVLIAAGVFIVALGTRTRGAAGLAVAAGLCYGVTDAAIKVIAVHWGRQGAAALASGWLALALLGTGAGYLSFQAALRDGNAISAVSLMTAMAALVALACGLLGLDEPFGRGPLISAAHLLAAGLVLACVYALAAAQADLVSEIG
jgi:hypothetical protein